MANQIQKKERCFSWGKNVEEKIAVIFTYKHPHAKSQPCHCTELEHEVDVDQARQRWYVWHQRNLAHMENF
jgi:hypothetical protein